MVLVDTSVWIDFLRSSRSSDESQILASLIKQEEDVAICGVIRQEILQGIRDDLTARRVRYLLNQVDYLPLKEPEIFDEAAEIYRTLRARGATLRSPADCLIAAVAIRSNVPILHRDRDFDTLARWTKLSLYRV